MIPLRSILALVLLLGLAPHAGASDFQASPVRLYLDDALRSEVINLVNRGAKPVRLQITTHLWKEPAVGELQLEPTSALVVFPSLLTLAPGERRTIRVGTLEAPVDREASYRILIEELPSQTSEAGADQGIAIRTRLSIPVFSAPRTARSKPGMEAPRLEGRTLVLAIVNAGQRHVRIGELLVTLEPARGAAVATRLPGWYVLAGGRREYRMALPKGMGCLQRVRVSVPVEGSAALESNVVVDDPSCGR